MNKGGRLKSQLKKKLRKEELPLKQHFCHDMRAIGEKWENSNSCLGNSKKAYHGTKAASQHLIFIQQF